MSSSINSLPGTTEGREGGDGVQKGSLAHSLPQCWPLWWEDQEVSLLVPVAIGLDITCRKWHRLLHLLRRAVSTLLFLSSYPFVSCSKGGSPGYGQGMSISMKLT